ncbi:protein kinase C (PKC)-like Pck2 [Cichlidogyrus casuarinus]|uniref:phosphoenolpyruvate carboxykinase (GTP) n=1 Tax=Cichlidogyrus casuarinus TaxID=1844966 RepID=A0ABD2PYD6_9PLAT
MANIVMALQKCAATLQSLPAKVREFVEEAAQLMEPDDIKICDGSEAEIEQIRKLLLDQGIIHALAQPNNFAARTDPNDVARVESKTFICTPKEETTVPTPKTGVKGTLGNWLSPKEKETMCAERFPGCMHGRTMYVLPFSMGAVGGKLSRIGVEVTDSPFVVLNMYIMTRVGSKVMDILKRENCDFVKAVHTVGVPKEDTRPVINGWPCNPEKTMILHIPDEKRIMSFGSGYGGNSLLGKKCFALRIASVMGNKEGWLAEHMLIVGIKPPNGKKRYLTAAFPSACGKTNLAMLKSTLPGYEVTCVGDDIAWMRFNPEDGRLYAINPENGFFGVAPGTSNKTNPNAMDGLTKNCIFTNVATTKSGKVFWEGLEDDMDISKEEVTDWKNQSWQKGCGRAAAHPNSRFTAPACQCPIVDEHWESHEGVPIDGIIFGGRRPEGVPLIYEANDWDHGVFLGTCMRSESTAAAEHKGKMVMHDPFAMRPFFGYNFCDYVKHWLSFSTKSGLKLPKIFHVNWFRKDEQGNFMWPGFGDNIRAMDWVLKRIEGTVNAQQMPYGNVPLAADFNISGMTPQPNLNKLFEFDKQFWQQECKDIRKYFDEQMPGQLPPKLISILDELEKKCQ